MATVYYDKDADLSALEGRKVAIIGYGSQGHAHALNLKDSGIDVRVGLYDGSPSRAKAEGAGLKVTSVAQAADEADVIMILLPDTKQKSVYEKEILPGLRDGKALFFAHGFNIHFGQIKRPAGRPVRRRERAHQGRLRDADARGVPAGGRLLRVHARAEADRRPSLRRRLQVHALFGFRHGRIRRLHARQACDR